MKTQITALCICLFAVAQAQTKYGVLVNGALGLPDKIAVAKKLDVLIVRDAIIMQKWNGHDESYSKFLEAGFTVIPNINWGVAQNKEGGKTPVPYPTDTVVYKKILSNILQIYHPPLIVIENEELIKKYHSGAVKDYINQLSAAIGVAHAKGVKVTNGGLTNKELTLLVYRDFLQRGMPAQANTFAGLCIKPGILKAAQNPGTNPEVDGLIARADSLIKAYKILPLDYVNIHIYEPIKNSEGGTDESAVNITPNAIAAIIDFVKNATGKKIISNESGTRSSSAALTKAMLNAFNTAGLEYCIWFSGDGEGGAKALQNTDASLRANGEVFKQFMAQQKQQ